MKTLLLTLHLIIVFALFGGCKRHVQIEDAPERIPTRSEYLSGKRIQLGMTLEELTKLFPELSEAEPYSEYDRNYMVIEPGYIEGKSVSIGNVFTLRNGFLQQHRYSVKNQDTILMRRIFELYMRDSTLLPDVKYCYSNSQDTSSRIDFGICYWNETGHNDQVVRVDFSRREKK